MHRFALFLLTTATALAQLPEFYKSVDRISWVVSDVDRVTNGWSKFDFVKILDRGELQLTTAEYQGRPAAGKLRFVTGKIRDMRVLWIQPLGGQNAYAEFLRKNGDGVFSLLHRVSSLDALQKELDRLSGLGTKVLQRETLKDGVQQVYLDTAGKGKFALGLAFVPAGREGDPAATAEAKINQFAFVVREPKTVSAFWERLGFPALACNHGTLRNLRYRDTPGDFDSELCWQRHGKVPYEWILSLKGPNVYEDHLKAHGEGIQHFGFPVDDIDKASAEWKGMGFPVSQSGAWGEEGQKGSGRFAYIDTTSLGGMSFELLWSFR